MTPSPTQLSAISRIFSSSVFREIAKKGRSATFARLFVQTGLDDVCRRHATVADGFDAAFKVLKRAGQRDEYIYRAALTEKVLLGTHSLRTASMLTEFRAGACKADVVILNGTATVYEIKSERDSLSRLSNQTANYRKVFAAVNVIASGDHLDGVLASVADDVGVLCLSKDYRIKTVRRAEANPSRICPVTLFESLRATEAKAVLKLLGRKAPQVPNTCAHAETRKLFAHLDAEDVHRAMVTVLKKSRDLAPLSHLVLGLPKSLHPAALTIRLQRREHSRLLTAMSAPLSEAMAWA